MPSISPRISSTPVRLAASISRTSTCRSSAMALHASQSPHGSIVGLSLMVQLTALAINRAVVVFPIPRTPVRRNA